MIPIRSIHKLFRSQTTAIYSRSKLVLLMIIQIVILSTIINHTQAQTVNDLVNALKKMKIVPDLLPNPPASIANFNINNKSIKPGDTLNSKDLKNLPDMKWEANPDARSTVILLDIDRHLRSQNNTINSYNHLTTVNIPGDDVRSGMAIVAYDPPGKAPASPCLSGSKHRYLLLVYHQNEVIDLSKLLDLFIVSGYNEKREDFKLNSFATNHGLTLQAANAFYMQASEGGGLCSGSSSNYQISNWSSSITMIVSSLFMLLITYVMMDSLN